MIARVLVALAALCACTGAPACVSFSFDAPWPGVSDARRAALARASALFVLAAPRWCAPVSVVRVAPGAGPRILVRPERAGPHRILLPVTRGFSAARFVYPLAHELCHLASGYERLEGFASNWLHEALCEGLSHAVLRSDALASLVPGGALVRYSRARLARAERWAPVRPRLRRWLARYEPRARRDRYLRGGHRVLALHLAPVFARSVCVRAALASLPPSSLPLRPYLLRWRALTPPAHRAGVDALAGALGIGLGPVAGPH